MLCLPAAARLNHSELLTWWIYDVWSAAQGCLKLHSYHWCHWLMHIGPFKVHSSQRNVWHECIYTCFDWLHWMRLNVISCTGDWMSCPIKEKTWTTLRWVKSSTLWPKGWKNFILLKHMCCILSWRLPQCMSNGAALVQWIFWLSCSSGERWPYRRQGLLCVWQI